ncbi:P-loop NTPase fold protein [Enterobacter hormaechei]|uniref:P-loop NTPase fold protein n=1 Tax=Enterobacter hormaechei TaxID=158836 RepID=UPI002016EA4B|nr:P-loop NTPase fold protein [Enterobacter hormaechei]
MTLRLQTESPADQDMFRGSSHEKVAENVAQIIRTPDVNIIGLEGELGSGKSTILKFLQKKLKDDFTFINFDAERYHHGSTKKALIDVIHHGVSLQCPGPGMCWISIKIWLWVTSLNTTRGSAAG